MAATRSKGGVPSASAPTDSAASASATASVSPLLTDSSGVDGQTIELAVKAAAHQHSWRYAPPVYTAASCLIWFVFFFQPHWLRVAIWGRLRPLIEDERWFGLVGSLVCHTLVFGLANLVMWAIYAAQLPFFEQFRIQRDKPWPWQRGPLERAAYFALIRKSIGLLLFNQYLLSPVMMWIGYEGQKQAGMHSDLDSVPHWYTSLWQIAAFMVIEDTLFYWAHRALHMPAIYGYVHKVHHQYKTSIGIASEYAHPIEFIFSNVIPFTAGPLLFGCHYWTLWQWMMLRVGETVDGHSGYEFPWSPYRLLPMSGSSTGHEFHHSHNVGNFGSFFSYWDRICGTDQAFVKWEKKQAAMAQSQQAQQAKLVAQGKIATNKTE